MPASKKIRLDQLLTEKGLFQSRTRAQAAIMAGNVLIDGRRDVKPGERFNPDVKIEIVKPDCPYVSRGGLKLEGALEDFKLDPTGWNILDIGASTGGFTDCLLKMRASHITSLDVGKGLIDWSLRTDNRVTVIENTNARIMTPEIATGPFDAIVIDVSFISLKLIFPNLPARLKKGGLILALIKPQFEAGPGRAPKGIISDPEIWREVLESFTSDDLFDTNLTLGLIGLIRSKIEGREGNREFFGLWQEGRESEDPDAISVQILKAIE